MSVRPPFVLVAAIACAVVMAAAQAPPQPSTPANAKEQLQPPTFRTEANFVRVDVYATAKGSPVKNLVREDFQVFEDGVAQTVATFEQVDVRTGVPQEQRAEPNTIQQSREALKNPRARVFVLFLDVPHVSVDGAWHAREPLVRMIDRLMGPEDLVGIMTPRMSAGDIVFARKTQVMESGLRDRWPWGERHTLEKDEQERLYETCYPSRDVVTEMTARKRERATLEALHELVTWLRVAREERKAILTVSEGWLLYRPNEELTRLRAIDRLGTLEPVPGPDPIGVGPDGRITRAGRNTNTGVPKSECDADRLALSLIDDERYFRDVIDEANRSNATFYTIDPRGLPVFDAPVGPDKPPIPGRDLANLGTRHDSLRVLAINTDGFAVLNNNNLDPGLRRISDDLTSYYLLGYYSTNTKLDGRFRNLKVSVRRPGVEIRARRGYKAATESEVTNARSAAAAPVPESVAVARDALAGLSRLRSGAALYTHAVARRGTGTTVWVAGELTEAAPSGASAIFTVSTLGATNSAEVQIPAGDRGFVAPVTLRVPAFGPVDVRVRLTPGEGQPAVTDAVRIDAASGLTTPLMFRRGPSTGNRLVPAGQPQFSRTERARFELPLATEIKLTAARVLDRSGAATSIPVSVTERSDPDGQSWGTAEIVLAPLGPGDYVIELSGTVAGAEQKVLAAFRITR